MRITNPGTLLSRRLVLRQAGVAVTLPLFSSLLPRQARAATKKRMVLWFQPDGCMEASQFGSEPWWPSGGGSAFTMAPHTQPLAEVKTDLVFMKGVHNASSQLKMLDSVHGTMLKNMLTGGGKDSFDQVIAKQLNAGTRFPSLEFGVGTTQTGKTDTRMSYANDAALTPEADPRRVFSRLFGGTPSTGTAPQALPATDPAIVQLHKKRKSVLDAVRSELAELKPRLSASDAIRMDEHTTAIRSAEKALVNLDILNPGDTNGPLPVLPASCTNPPVDMRGLGEQTYSGTVPNMDRIAAVQHDLMLLALRCDLTRVATVMFMQGRDDQQSYEFLPISAKTTGQHVFAHAWSNASKVPTGKQDYGQVHLWRARMFRDLIKAMKAIPDDDGTTLFDNTLLAWISEMGDGSHNYKNMPWVLSGRAGGNLQTDRYLNFANENHTNVLMAMAAKMGVTLSTFGVDGTRATPNL